MRFHDLRRSCASLLLAQGLDLKLIQEILGHSTITITANLYAHVLMGPNRQAANQMDLCWSMRTRMTERAPYHLRQKCSGHSAGTPVRDTGCEGYADAA